MVFDISNDFCIKIYFQTFEFVFRRDFLLRKRILVQDCDYVSLDVRAFIKIINFLDL